MGSELVETRHKLPRIDALSGLKVLCLFAIIAWHFGIQRFGIDRSFDIGARMVEVFFICSGALMAYNHGTGFTFTPEESLGFFWSRYKKVWPLHALVFVASLVVALIKHDVEWGPSLVCTSGLFLSLTHAWCPDVALIPALSGASWYLSALAFCWLMTPAIAYAVQRASYKLGTITKGGLAVAAVLLAVRIFLEVCVNIGIWGTLSLHSNPFVRCLEYAAAYCLVVAIREYLLTRNSACVGGMSFKAKLAWTAAELAIIFGAIAVWVVFDETWWRCAYTIVAMALVFVFLAQGGFVSRVLSTAPLRWLATLELGIYLTHQLVISVLQSNTVTSLLPVLAEYETIRFLLVVAVTIAVSFAWTKLSHYVRERADHEH